MKIRKFWILLTLVLAGIAPVGAGVVWGAGGHSSAESPVPLAQNCGSVTLPKLAAEVNTVLDKERGLLTISSWSGLADGDSTVTVRYDDPACLAVPGLARVIQHVVETDAQTQADSCASMRELVASNATVVRGVRVNPDAGREYLADWC
jgi:hypothetical protein